MFAGQTTSRNRVFRVFQGPITDGSNSGITTTDPTDVTVTVNGVPVSAVSVDGANRAVTLPYAPASGSTVLITYFWNAWQDTFDYLANINVTEITRCGIVPGSSDFIEEADFILDDNKIVWGAAALVNAANTTDGATPFDAQISTTLVDQKTFLVLLDRVDPADAAFPALVVVVEPWRTTHRVAHRNALAEGARLDQIAAAVDVIEDGRVALESAHDGGIFARELKFERDGNNT